MVRVGSILFWMGWSRKIWPFKRVREDWILLEGSERLDLFRRLGQSRMYPVLDGHGRMDPVGGGGIKVLSYVTFAFVWTPISTSNLTLCYWECKFKRREWVHKVPNLLCIGLKLYRVTFNNPRTLNHFPCFSGLWNNNMILWLNILTRKKWPNDSPNIVPIVTGSLSIQDTKMFLSWYWYLLINTQYMRIR